MATKAPRAPSTMPAASFPSTYLDLGTEQVVAALAICKVVRGEVGSRDDCVRRCRRASCATAPSLHRGGLGWRISCEVRRVVHPGLNAGWELGGDEGREEGCGCGIPGFAGP